MPPRERPETAAPTKVVKMKNTPSAGPGAPSPAPKLAVGSSPTKPASKQLPAVARPISDLSEPVTNPLLAGTRRASPPPPSRPSRPSPMPVVHRPVTPAGLAASAFAPRISSSQLSPAALAARAVGRAADPAAPLRVAGTTLQDGPEATAIVKPLPLPEASDYPMVQTLPGEGRRRRRPDLGKWLIGGAVAVGALVVAFLAGAFDRPSAAERPTASAAESSGEESSPRKRKQAQGVTDSELRSEDAPPRTVGNSATEDPAAGAQPAKATQEPPPEAAKPAATAEPPATKLASEPPATTPASEPPPETAKSLAAAEPPETDEPAVKMPPPETAKPAVAAKQPPPEAAPETAKPAVAPKKLAETKKPPKKLAETKKPAVAVKKPAKPAKKLAETKKPPTKPAKKPAKKAPTTAPQWDPDSLFPK